MGVEVWKAVLRLDCAGAWPDPGRRV